MKGISATRSIQAVRLAAHDSGLGEAKDAAALAAVPKIFEIDLLDARERARTGEILLDLTTAHDVNARRSAESMHRSALETLQGTRSRDIGLGQIIDTLL